MGTKVKELTPITKAKKDDSRCVICYPPDPNKRLKEDQIWGRCRTNGKHTH